MANALVGIGVLTVALALMVGGARPADAIGQRGVLVGQGEPTTGADPSSSTTSVPETSSTSSSTTSTSLPGSSGSTTSSSVQPGGSKRGPGPSIPVGALARRDPALLQNLIAGNDELSAEELDLLSKFLGAQDAVNEVTEQLIQTNDELLQTQREIEAAASRVEEADERVRRTADALGMAQGDLGVQQGRLQAEAVSAYISGGRSAGAAQALVSASSIDDLSKARVYAGAIVAEQQSLIDHYRELRSRTSELRMQADADREAALGARDELSAHQHDLDAKRAELVALRDRKQVAVDEQVSLLAEVEAKRAEFSEKLAALSQSGGSASERLKARQAGQVLPSVTNAIFAKPLAQYTLTSRYGYRSNPLYGSEDFHPGIDMAAPTGTPIMAAADGIVVLAEWNGGYGNCVIIDHGNGIATLYGHQSRIAASEGDSVTEGQTIGYVGSTGYSTGPHLHFEVRVFGETTDPLPYLKP